MTQRPTRREAIVEAMIQVAGSKGYLQLSVADVLAEARVSRTTFYKHFDDREDCFLAAFDTAIERLIEVALAGCEGRRRPLHERARSGLAAVVELLASEPQLARVAVVEVVTAGAEARRRQLKALARFAQMVNGDRKPPLDSGLPESTAMMAVGAVVGLLFDELRERGAVDRRTLPAELEFALLVPLVGPRVAAEACGRTAAA